MTATRHISSLAHCGSGSDKPDTTEAGRAGSEPAAPEVEDLSFLPDPADWAPLASFRQGEADQDDLLQENDEPALPRWPSLPDRPVRGTDSDEPQDPHDG